MFDRETTRHLMGIVAIWMTNGNKPVDGGNDTRYEFFSGSWCDAAEATDVLIEYECLAHASLENDYLVIPTAKGIYEAIR